MPCSILVFLYINQSMIEILPNNLPNNGKSKQVEHNFSLYTLEEYLLVWFQQNSVSWDYTKKKSMKQYFIGVRWVWRNRQYSAMRWISSAFVYTQHKLSENIHRWKSMQSRLRSFLSSENSNPWTWKKSNDSDTLWFLICWNHVVRSMIKPIISPIIFQHTRDVLK